LPLAFERENQMTDKEQSLDEAFVRLTLAINEHLPGYVDSYFGPQEWSQEAKGAGKLPLEDLSERTERLTTGISAATEMDAQRRDFLARQATAMRMSLRLLAGDKVSLAEEVEALYDVQPEWKDESIFREAQRRLAEILPVGDSLKERLEAWNKSLEIPVETVKDLLPAVIDRLRERTLTRFGLPENESFTVEFVSDQPWGGYNWYLGEYTSRIDINTDLPARIDGLVGLMAHEAYPGHHTEHAIKEFKLVRQKDFQEHVVTLINSPSCVIAEGIATTALKTVIADDELEDWYRSEILPRAGLSHIDAARMVEIGRAGRQMAGVVGNVAFMLHDQQKSAEELSAYLQEYALDTEKEANHFIQFVSNPLFRSYVFTYHVGYELLEELFAHVGRDRYFARLLEQPVTPSQIRGWIKNSPRAEANEASLS
jgi:hypothetical protein